MKGSAAYQSIQKRGLHLGLLPALAADVNGSTPITLDHDLDVLPGEGRHLTVSRLADLVDDLAARLWAAGVRPGEHVVVHKRANADVWVLACAASRIGAVPVMLSPALDAATVGALLQRLERPNLLTDGHKLDALAAVGPAELARRVIIVSGERPGAQSLGALAGAPRVDPVVRPIDEAAVITHTSGTTGLPKLVVHTPRTQGMRLRPQWRLLSLMRRKETVAIHISFVHSRMVAAMALALLKEMPVLLMNESDPGTVAELFLANRPGLVEALPNSLMDWEALTEDPRRPFASVKYFSSTFDAIHPRTMSRLLKSSQRRGALFFQIYGQSEVGPAVGRAYFRNSAHRANGRCVGWQMPGGAAKVRVVSRDGRPPSQKNPGSIEVAWPGLAKTYFAEQDRYDSNRDGRWWRTGDVGYRTRLGCLHLLDREVDMIPGVSSSLEVEDLVLSRLDELSELVVIQGPGSEPVPVVCTHDDRPLDRGRWRAATAGFPQLADPVQIPLAELPRTATLKVQRLALAERLRDRLEDRPGDQLEDRPGGQMGGQGVTRDQPTATAVGTADAKETGAMTPEATLARLREHMVGPSRFMTVLSSFELGLVDALRDRPGMTAAELGDAVGAKPDAVEQLLHLLVKEGFVARDGEDGAYSLDALAGVAEGDLRRALAYMNMIKVVALRQLFYLTDSARTGTPVGLKELYGVAGGTLYGAVAEHRDLREAWANLMNTVTANIDPWFFGNIDIPAGARVLDLAGNTGLGAIHTYRHKASPGLRVTTFDLPEKEKEALDNFAAHGVAEHCSFIGGDVFDGVPRGFDVVLIKHFLDMFDKDDVVRILKGVNESLEAGGQVNIMVPVYPEDITDTDNFNVDFFPAFFIGCAMGQGGPQKLSTYQGWLEECGFTVTRAVTKDPAGIPQDVIPVQAVLSATKTA